MNERTCKNCKGEGFIPDGKPARIDTLRNRVTSTVGLLLLLAEELEDLHVLAYNRPASVGEERVKGGSRDFALDTHGDPKARDAFRDLNRVTLDLAELATIAAHDAVKVLTAGEVSTKGTRRSIKFAELADKIRAQAERVKRGEYTPIRRMAQPDNADALRAAQTSTEEARREFKAMRRLARWLWENSADVQHLPPDLDKVAQGLYPAKQSA